MKYKNKFKELANAIMLTPWTTAYKDLFLICFASIILLIPTIYFDAFDVFVYWYVKQPEPYELEEIIPVMLLLPVGLGLFSWRRWKELKKTIEEIQTLKGIIPICASCKKIRDDQGYWHQVEEYIRDHSDAEFSHGLCPECTQKLYAEMAELSSRKRTHIQING